MKFRASALLSSALVLALVAAINSLTTWYSVDRVGMLTSLCETGLSNFTRPGELDEAIVGCTVLEPKRRYFGRVRDTPGDTAYFTSAELEKQSEHTRLRDNTVRLICRDLDCGAALESKLEETKIEHCLPEHGPLRLAGVIVEGWVSEESTRFGHLGEGIARSLYVDRVIEVFDPPISFVESWHWIGEDRPICERANP